MSDSIEQLSFELSVDALREQERALAGLRTRAAAVLATASVAGSLARAGADRGTLRVTGVCALASFVLALWSAIWIMLPHELVFSLRGQDILELADSLGSRDIGQVYRQTGEWIDEYVQENRETLRKLAAWLTASCVFLSIEVVLFGASFVS